MAALRALTDTEAAEREAIKARILAEWREGKYATAAECKAALATATAHLGRPILVGSSRRRSASTASLDFARSTWRRAGR